MEVKGRKVKMSIWVRSSSVLFVRYAEMVSALSGTALFPLASFTRRCHRIRRAKNASAPLRRRTTAAHRGSSLVCLPFLHLHSTHGGMGLPVGVHARTRETVYDVSNRESFEALPRWLEELENYVPPEVVKIVVGNKLDKVRAPRPLNLSLSPIPYAHSCHSNCLPAPADRTRARTGILPAGADDRGRVICPAHRVSVRRGIRQDGGGRDRGVQRRRRAHHRHARAVGRGEAQGIVVQGTCGGVSRG